jgi:hypothetical protein
VASDTGGGWQGDVTPPDEPPPTPFERGREGSGDAAAGVPGPLATPAAPRRGRRRGRVLLLVALAIALVAAGAVLLDGRSDPAADGGPTAAAADADADADADVALLELLETVDAAELAMLGFDEAAGAAFEEAASEDEVLVLLRAAAAKAVAALGSERDALDEPLDASPAEAVRVAYLPHLDAWVAYLEAVAEDPEVLFGSGQEAFILRINATAGVFSAALEEAVADGVGPEVEAAARAILDRGFPDQEDADL